jgi:hypothetical protein
MKQMKQNDLLRSFIQEIETKVKISQVYIDQDNQLKKELKEQSSNEGKNEITIEENKDEPLKKLATYNRYTDKGILNYIFRGRRRFPENVSKIFQ